MKPKRKVVVIEVETDLSNDRVALSFRNILDRNGWIIDQIQVNDVSPSKPAKRTKR